jgi:hypothetical protein
MAKEDFSPEEKLLNIIEENEGGSVSVKSVQGIKDLDGPKTLLRSITDWFRGIYSFKKWSLSELNLRIVNRVFAVFLAVLIIFLAADFITSRPNLKKIYPRVSELAANTALNKEPITFLEPVSIYINAPKKRDIFNPLSVTAPEKLSENTSLLIDLIKDLRLVGIYWSRDPEAMIEHIKEKKTYFLKIGQTIKGAKVKGIFEDRVILEYNNEETELM